MNPSLGLSVHYDAAYDTGIPRSAGATYRGPHNVSAHGVPCIPWPDVFQRCTQAGPHLIITHSIITTKSTFQLNLSCLVHEFVTATPPT